MKRSALFHAILSPLAITHVTQFDTRLWIENINKNDIKENKNLQANAIKIRNTPGRRF